MHFSGPEQSDDSGDDGDALTFAEERLEDDEELKLHALSNQLTWKRLLVCRFASDKMICLA